MKRIILPILLMATVLLGACAEPTTVAPTTPEVTPPPETTEEEKELPSGAISWDEAKYHIGERTTVCGPVVDTHWASGSKGEPTFLNIGKPYPDPNRFTVVIWIDCRANFPQAPEKYYSGKTICVSGLIIEYKGVTEIEVCHPSEIEEQ